MDERTCTCGFVPTDDYHLTDHLGEVFIPADCRGPDGRLHAEAAGDARACLCGYRASGSAALDAHILSAFTPSGTIGPDGRRHIPAD
ncbi:MAG TPA: hypothetical protein VHZ03_04045 [Trebonia sp.]|jgi:hypothetical protein|nr:hypothetical protein [Trebonia sp.]